MTYNKKMVKRLFKKGKSIEYISKQTGVSLEVCEEIISEPKLKPVKKPIKNNTNIKQEHCKTIQIISNNIKINKDLNDLSKSEKIEIAKQLYEKGVIRADISKMLNLSYTVINYHVNKGVKEYRKKYRKKISKDQKFKYTLRQKIKRFQLKTPVETPYSEEDVLNYIKKNPYCYISKEPIDVYDISTYSFDHYIPIAKGGSSELDNLRICKLKYNKMKQDLLFDEFVAEIKKLYEIHC